VLTRWGYTNMNIIVYDTYSTQLFPLRFKVVPELRGKVKYERERLNTVLNVVTSKVVFSYIELCFKTFKIKYLGAFWAQNTIKMKREVRRIHWYTAKNEKTNDTKVIKDQTYRIFHN
jgi:hypothetical protein